MATTHSAQVDKHSTDKSHRNNMAGDMEHEAKEAEGFGQAALGYWNKANNDWIWNLSGVLAYNLLLSIFPILVALLGIVGIVLNNVAPGTQTAILNGVAKGLGGTGNNISGTIVKVVQGELIHSGGLALAIGIVGSVWAGSRLFVTMESCLSIVYRIRQRNIIRQNLMAFGMLLIFAVLIPVIALAAPLSSTFINALFPSGSNIFGRYVLQILTYVLDFVVGALLFGAIYIVVPNRKVAWREVLIGTAFAAVLLVLYEILFPIYETLFLHPSNYGSVAGFAIVILVFFYYLGFILILGAELNSYLLGQRATEGDITAVMHEVQAHNSTRGAAGPTAGTPAEDIQHHKGAAAMATPADAVEHERKDHKADAQPPKFAETGEPNGPDAARPQTPESVERTRKAQQRYGGKPARTSGQSAAPEQGSTQQAAMTTGTTSDTTQQAAMTTGTTSDTTGDTERTIASGTTGVASGSDSALSPIPPIRMTTPAEEALRRKSQRAKQSVAMTSATAAASFALFLMQRGRSRRRTSA